MENFVETENVARNILGKEDNVKEKKDLPPFPLALKFVKKEI